MADIFLKILNMSISAGWVVLAVVLLRFMLWKMPKWLRVMLWGIVGIRLICPVSIESIVSLIPSSQTVSPEIMLDPVPAVQTGIPVLNSVVNPVISQTFAPEPAAGANPLQLWIPLLGWAWLAGVILMYAYIAVSYWRLGGKVREAVLLRDNIYQVHTIGSPFVLGLFAPKIYLPYDIAPQHLPYVIAHEQAHIQRRDHWWKPIGFLLLACHWFNPAVWAGYILLCRDIELACDERVVKDFGGIQRADYSQALLGCSVKRKRVSACPLAFGEVCVKKRIRSVLSYKKPGLRILVIAVLVCILAALCFLTDPASTVGQQPLEIATLDVSSSADGTVEFQMAIEEELMVDVLPVIEVVPHYLTEEDARRVASVLFGERQFYEQEPVLRWSYSKNEIQQRLRRWSDYTTPEALMTLFPWKKDDAEYLQRAAQVVASFIETYEGMYQAAPEEKPHAPCRWQYQKNSAYLGVAEEEMAGYDLEADTDAIRAVTWEGEMQYVVSALTRNKEDYKLSNIFACLDTSDSPYYIDEHIFRARLLRTEKPTEQQLVKAAEIAAAYLRQMNLGQWRIDRCYISQEGHEDSPEYVIRVTAVPVFEGISVLRRQQVAAREQGFYLTNAEFDFSANGELISFMLNSPVDIVKKTDAPESCSVEGLLDAAETQLRGCSWEDFAKEYAVLTSSESVGCKVTVTECKYGLTRRASSPQDESFLYVPGLTLYGNVEFYRKDSGMILSHEENVLLITVDASDAATFPTEY